MNSLEKQNKKDKPAHNLFEDSVLYLITELKDTKITYFLRENDLICYLYKNLFNKLNRRKELFIDYKRKKLFPIFTEHQYEQLPAGYLGGKAIDLVFLSDDTKINIALEVKFSTPVKRNEKKSSAGKKVLLKDINKLKGLDVPYSYFLYCKEEGRCFLTYEDCKERKSFFDSFNFDNKNKFLMFYVEKDVEKESLTKFYIYTINQKDYSLVRIKSIKDRNPIKHFNIIIYSNSKKTKEDSVKNQGFNK